MFSYGLPVAGQKRGGIERSAHTIADGLARRGHEVVVFTHDPKPAEAAYDVRPLPWKAFVDTWVGRRMTMGYLGNVLAASAELKTQIDNMVDLAAIDAGELKLDLREVEPVEFLINLRSARALGLEIPDRLLALADEVIE